MSITYIINGCDRAHLFTYMNSAVSRVIQTLWWWWVFSGLMIAMLVDDCRAHAEAVVVLDTFRAHAEVVVVLDDFRAHAEVVAVVDVPIWEHQLALGVDSIIWRLTLMSPTAKDDAINSVQITNSQHHGNLLSPWKLAFLNNRCLI